jgi:hypothetical protein
MHGFDKFDVSKEDRKKNEDDFFSSANQGGAAANFDFDFGGVASTTSSS